MADDYEELAQRIIDNYDPDSPYETFRLKSDPQEISQDLESGQFNIKRIGDRVEPFERAKEIAKAFAQEFNGQEVEVWNNNELLFEDTLKVERDRDDLDISFKKAERKLDNPDAEDIINFFREGTAVHKMAEKGRKYNLEDDPREDDWNNFNEILGHAGVSYLRVKKKPEPEPEPEPEPSPGIPEGEEPEEDDSGDEEQNNNPINRRLIMAVSIIIGYMVLKK